MKLAAAPARYDAADQARLRGALEQADADNLKRGVALPFVLLAKPDGTVGRLTVDSSGALIWTAI
ncbi:MAG TPA: hypothetical protein VMU59_14125 [Caulobacteraceae bacterium]|nr:hypothetical protein [Caulobacteraceae bacterium]